VLLLLHGLLFTVFYCTERAVNINGEVDLLTNCCLNSRVVSSAEEPLLVDLNSPLVDTGLTPPEETSSGTEEVEHSILSNQPRSKRIAFLFDSTLTAFLMMGNLSPVRIICILF
jgi:hypothetical protein